MAWRGEVMRIREATPADAAAVARVHWESWRATYHGLIPDETYAALSLDKSLNERQAHWTAVLAADGAERVYVAENDRGEVFGIASGGPCRTDDPADARYAGELYVLHVLPSGQRHGIGRALVRAVAWRLADAKMHGMLVWVLCGNGGAGRFYEALGGQFVREAASPFMGVPVPEVAYGWADTAALREE